MIAVGEKEEIMIDMIGSREHPEYSRNNQMNVDGESTLRPQYMAFTLTNWKDSSA